MTSPAAIYLQDAHPIAEGMEYVKYAEEKGFDAVWQADSRLVRDAIVPMSAAAVVIIVGVLIFAFGETIYSPVAPAITNDLAPDHLRGRYNAMVSWTWAVSGVVGPGLAGVLLGAGLPGAWLVVVIVGLLAGSVLLASLRRFLTPAQDGRA